MDLATFFSLPVKIIFKDLEIGPLITMFCKSLEVDRLCLKCVQKKFYFFFRFQLKDTVEPGFMCIDGIRMYYLLSR